MKALILSLNRSRVPIPVLPIGACMTAESAADAGHDVRLLDFMFQHDPIPSLVKTLNAFKPDVIGISVRNIDNNDMRFPVLFAEELQPVMQAIRRNSHASVVLGGSAVSIMPEAFLRYTGASFAISGHCASFPKLLECFNNQAGFAEVSGLSYILDDKFCANPNHQKDSAKHSLAPNYHRWINVRAYRTSLAAFPMKTKTGCGFQCVYCTYNTVDGDRFHLHKPKEVARVVKQQVELGFKDIEFVDNVFNYPYDHAMSICDEIIRSGVKARLQSMEMHPAYLDDALLTSMEGAGFKGIGVTVESASDRVLERFEKGFTVEHVNQAAEAIRRHAIPCLWFFMLGGPGETQATVEETLNFAKKRIRPRDVAYFTIGIRVYPGTRLQSIAEEQGALPADSGNLFHPVFYVSPELDTAWLIKKVQNTVKGQSNFIIAGEANMPMMPVIYRLGYSLGVRSPLWRFTPLLRKGMNLFGVNS